MNNVKSVGKKSKLKLHGRNHLFHMVQPSIWPIFTAYGLFIFLSGLIYYMHYLTYGGIYMITGFILLVYCAYFWFSAIISEATFLGYHTLVVKRGLKRGFLLFLVSELMLFLGFFLSIFSFSVLSINFIGFNLTTYWLNNYWSLGISIF